MRTRSVGGFVLLLAVACGSNEPVEPSVPALVSAVTPTTMTAAVGTDVETPPTVLVTSVDGTRLDGVPVAFAVTQGNGTITSTTAVTQNGGHATVGSWTLGPALGANAVSATVTSLAPIVFSAVGVANQGFDRSVRLELVASSSANASLGDLDGDGDLDIVLAKGRHSAEIDFVLFNDGSGDFSERHSLRDVPDRTYSASAADLDGDGDLDIVAGNDTPDEKLTYANDGTGAFTRSGTFGEAQWTTRNVTVADLNGDDRPDIVVANRGSDVASYVCLNNGAGGFPACSVLASYSTTTIVASDVTGDGILDLIVPQRESGQAPIAQSYVFVNDGQGAFLQQIVFGPGNSATRAVAAGDLDGDGWNDIVAGDETAGGAFVYLNRGGLSFAQGIAIGASTDLPWAIAVADLDADGSLDIVLGNALTRSAVLLNDGTGRAFSAIRFGTSTGFVYGLAIGDVNGDARPDIVAAKTDAVSMLYINMLNESAAMLAAPR